jgi:hypothetical protein
MQVTAPDTSRWQRSRIERSDRAALLVLAAGLLAGGVAVFLEGRGLTFFYDEWSYVVGRAGHSPSVFLRPHNEHPSIFPVAIYKTLFATAGLGHYWIYRCVHIALMELIAALVYAYGRPRIGRWWALFPALALAVVGAAPEYLLWPFELSFSLSIAGALGAVLAFDRSSRRADVVAAALWVVSLLSSGVGIALFAGFVVELALRGDRRERVWVVVAPALLYALWWVPYHAGHYPLSNVQHVPRFVEGEYTTGTGALTTLSDLNGPLAAVLVALVVVAACGVAGRRPRFWFVVGAPVIFWAATALVRYGISEPNVQRYAYVSAVLLALVVCELGAGRVRIAMNARAVAIAGLALAALVVNDIGLLHAAPKGIADFSRVLRPELGALELARGHVAPGFVPDAGRAPDIVAGRYFAARDRYPGGSPGDGADAIAHAAPDARAAADKVLFGALGLGAMPVADLPPAGLVRPVAAVVGQGAATDAGGGCLRFAPADPGASLTVTVPGGSLYVDNRTAAAAVTLSVRRFADAFTGPVATVAPRSAAVMAFPAAAADAHPFVVSAASPKPFAVCARR